MTDTPLPRVMLRLANGPIYARAGEATFCAKGHVLGHFVRDVRLGEVQNGDEVVPVPGMSIGTERCPTCDAPTNHDGAYYFLAPDGQVQQFRTMDEVDGASRARAWLESVMLRLAPPIVVEVQSAEEALRLKPWAWAVTEQGFRQGEGGGVLTLWVQDKPRAMAVLQRDQSNHTFTTLIEIAP